MVVEAMTAARYLLPLVLLAAPTFAQNKPTLLLDMAIGIEPGLGYKIPTVWQGVAVELPFGRYWHVNKLEGTDKTIVNADLRTRFELQFSVEIGSARKAVTGDGTSFRTRTVLIYWPTSRFGVVGAIGSSELWTSQFNKTALTPTFGVVFRDKFMGSEAGRTYVTYLLPSGCQWATVKNPCAIQSSRLQGVQVYPEWRLARYFRLGIRMAILHGLEQGNPNQRSAGRKGFLTFTSGVVLRFQFPGESYDEAY